MEMRSLSRILAAALHTIWSRHARADARLPKVPEPLAFTCGMRLTMGRSSSPSCPPPCPPSGKMEAPNAILERLGLLSGRRAGCVKAVGGMWIGSSNLFT